MRPPKSNYIYSTILSLKNKEINEIKNMRLNINNTSYHDYYNKVENPNFLINIILISAGIFIFCLLVFIIYVVSKKLKKDIF